MTQADSLVRTPLASTFSGWANAIRVERRGPKGAAFTTDNGYDWYQPLPAAPIELNKLGLMHGTRCKTKSSEDGSPNVRSQTALYYLLIQCVVRQVELRAH